jgi:uncharacterized protein (TIRG00374 family)
MNALDAEEASGGRADGRRSKSPAARLMQALQVLTLFLFFWILFTRFGQMETLVSSLRRGVGGWILVALLLQLLSFANQAAFFAALSRLTRTSLTARDFLRPVLAADFLNLSSPVGVFTGVALLAEQAERLGMSRAEAVMINALYYLLDYSAFLLVLFAGLVHLCGSRQLGAYEWIPAGLLSAGVLLALSIYVAFLARPREIGEALVRLAAKLKSRWPNAPGLGGFTEKRARASLASAEVSLMIMRRNPARFLRPCLHAAGVEVLGVLTLAALFLAFRAPASPGVLVAGYAMGTLFMIVSWTPSGLGWVEGMMTLTFVSLGASAEIALLVTMAYRGLSFWLPFLLGFAVFRSLRI